MLSLIKTILERDPAVRKNIFGVLEIILSVPGFHIMFFFRLAHFLHQIKIPIFPRFLMNIGKILTGIDIHPGAKIGKNFFIDHGTGVVIGETAIIGDNCTLYQGVTLGGTGKEKFRKRHPTLRNNITIGSGAKILGPVILGDHVKVGANSVVTMDVPDNCTVVGIPGRIARIRDKKILDDPTDYINLFDPEQNRIQKLKEEIGKLENEFEEWKKQVQDKSRCEGESLP
ncbi:MAG TPA: serine O-acetyltransferase [Spirochaetia bacterium]|nr:MAG: serine O-acetyltransferase [Spirochaetes bacterium GWB1_36_13]HCL56384.1 serine O-acetyltransferase [Spirochaetia bacterium]